MEQRVVEEREEDGWISIDDRISELPQPILEHILYFLPQRDAVKTCTLSKSWRYLWSTRPNIEFRESFFGGNYKNFMCGLDQTLQRYHDQKLPVQKFILEVNYYKTKWLLEKWIPILDVRNFNLVNSTIGLLLPSLIFNSRSLEELYLQNQFLMEDHMFRAHQRLLNPILQLRYLSKNLRTLSLTRVHIPDQILEKIISSCPLIGFMAFHVCTGLKTIKANKLHYLKSFEYSPYGGAVDCSIEIDNPTVETIIIESGSICLHHHSMHFPNLSSLKLSRVSLSSDSFGFFSRNCPNLERLAIIDCNGGFNELCISNGSIKKLILRMRPDKKLKDVIIDAPNIVKFEYEGDVPQSFSCTTSNSREWKSYITPVFVESSLSSLLIRLHELLKELSQSVISLNLVQEVNHWIYNYRPLALELPDVEPVVVEHLELSIIGDTRFQSAFISDLFHICRPRIVGRNRHISKLSQSEYYILMMERKGKKRFPWQHDLEEVRMEKFDKNGQVWRIVHWRGLSRTALRRRDFGPKIRLVLKWRNGDRP